MAWFSEIRRLAEVVEAYLEIKLKRGRAKPSGGFEFAPKVLMLCKQAGATDPVIIRILCMPSNQPEDRVVLCQFRQMELSYSAEQHCLIRQFSRDGHICPPINCQH